MNENCFSNFCEFRLISEGVASAPAVYSFLKYGTTVFLTFVPRPLFIFRRRKNEPIPLYVKLIIIRFKSKKSRFLHIPNLDK